MQQLLARALQEIADGVLGNAILEVGIYTTEGELLVCVVACLLEHIVRELTIVRGSGIKIGKKKYAPNAIFRVVSCLYILYDLTCSIWWKNSTHSLSYMAYHCFAKIVTSD